MIAEELTQLLYGSIVREVVATSEHITEANERLEKIGYNVGLKIVDDFFKDYHEKPCSKIVEMVDVFCTVALRKYLPSAETRYEDVKLTERGFTFNLRISANPLLKDLEFSYEQVQSSLQYQALLRGILRGAFEVLHFSAKVILIYQSLKPVKNQTIFFVEAVKM